MTWSRFWYVKTAAAWAVALWGALDWGDERWTLYLLVLSVAVSLAAISSGRVVRDRGRREAYEAGWQAREEFGKPRADVHRLQGHK